MDCWSFAYQTTTDMEKTVFISLPVDELQSIIIDCVKICLKQHSQPITIPTQDNRQPVKLDRICQLLDISESTARAWMRSGKIPFKRKGRVLYFFEDEVLNSLEQPKRRA